MATPFVHRVFHPTDFSEAAQRAFDHALAISLGRQASLTIMNASKGFQGGDWTRFPSIVKTLERWGLLEKGSDRAEVFERFKMKVKKVGVDAGAPADAILDYLAQNPTDLVVMATEGREGIPRVLRESVAERVGRTSGVRTLFVPADGKGFISSDDGSLALKRILVPVAEAPDPDDAAEIATRAAETLGDHPVTIHVLHVGEKMPPVVLPEGEAWTWEQSTRSGDPVEGILAAAKELDSDLIVMTTDGRDVLLDVFRGSHTERVVRGALCPVVAIPIPKD